MPPVLTPSPPRNGASQLTWPPMFRFSVEQYHDLIHKEVLASGEPVELLEGLLVTKMTRNPSHRIALAHLRDLLVTRMTDNWHLETQEAITLESSEPEPDLTVVRGQVDDYPDRHPSAADVALVVEVSDSTLVYDRGIKRRIYARAGIAEYWIVKGTSSETFGPQAGSLCHVAKSHGKIADRSAIRTWW